MATSLPSLELLGIGGEFDAPIQPATPGDLTKPSGLLGGPLFSFAELLDGLPVETPNFLGKAGEPYQLEDLVYTVFYESALEPVAFALLGGETRGDELVLYDPASAPIELTRGIPIVHEVTADFVNGAYPTLQSFVGVYSGGLLSEDYLQNFTTTRGTLGTLLDTTNEPITRTVPGFGSVLGDGSLNALLDEVTLAFDTQLYVDDLLAGALGGDEIGIRPDANSDGAYQSYEGAFSGLLGSLGVASLVPGSLSAGAPLFFEALNPISTQIQEVLIVGPIINANVGKLI